VQAWTFKLTGKAAAGVAPYGSLAATPMVQNGVVYLQDLDANVYALALATGKLEWECQFNAPERSGPGPNGVAVVDGTVYGETPTSAFALTAATGRTIWVNRNLLGKHQGTFGIQPQVANGRIHLASQYGSGPGGGVLCSDRHCRQYGDRPGRRPGSEAESRPAAGGTHGTVSASPRAARRGHQAHTVLGRLA
jgi:outer membrane protein assembly factor BamB